MTLQTNLIFPGCAQGKYILKARKCILAALRWGIATHPLENWDVFAYVPIDPAGNGVFSFPGKRAIPPGVTHVWARLYASDFSSFEDICAEIPSRYLPAGPLPEDAQRFSILTDLHLSSKPWKTRQALRATESDVVFLLGDTTNDGLPSQFDAAATCIRDTVPDKIILPVCGNHDIPRILEPGMTDGCLHYAAFQQDLLQHASRQGYSIVSAPDGRAYAVQIGNIDIIALQCVTTGRRFSFPEGRQIDWLEAHIAKASAAWHLLLCHAPLLKHNPNRTNGPPYLDKNQRIQEIIDRAGHVLFLNGHTHVSPNTLQGNVEYDAAHCNVYIDCGSVVATDTSGENGLMAPGWKDGCKTELTITKNTIEIRMSSIEAGVCFSRGCYRIDMRTAAHT